MAKHGLPGSVAPRDGNIPLALDIVPAGWDPIQMQLRQRFAQGRMSTCNYGAAKSHEMRFASLALALASDAIADTDADQKDKDKKDADKDKKDAGKDKKDADKDKKDKEKEKELKLPDEFLGQAIKEVVMHEVGHSLGLRHNFKASIMLKPEQINDTSITHVKGMTGSVMDYNPINVAPKGQKQGDYASTTIGPYDYWAIAYAYTPVTGSEEAELKKIAARSPEPDLAFATDDDFMEQRSPGQHLRPDAPTPWLMARCGWPWPASCSRIWTRRSSRTANPGLGSAARSPPASASSATVRILRPNTSAASPSTATSRGPTRRETPSRPSRVLVSERPSSCMVDQILSDKAFQFSPALLRKLVTESWQDSRYSSYGGMDYPIYRMILNIQEIALDQCLDSSVLQRVQNQEMQSEPGSNPLKIAEVFRSLSEGIFTELGAPPTGTSPFAISTIRRNLQREYIKRLSSMVLGPQEQRLVHADYGFVLSYGGQSSPPPDAKNLARLHLDEIGRKIESLLGRREIKIDDTTLAHLKEIQFRITKVLNANLSVNEP